MTDLTAKNEALTSDELDRVCGGIIIVGGLQHRFTPALTAQLNSRSVNPIVISRDRALNS